MSEFRKVFDLPAAKLVKADFKALGDIAADGMDLKPENGAKDKYIVVSGNARYEGKSVDELLSQDLLEAVDNFSLWLVSWDPNNYIDKTISINLRRNVAHCQISAFDEVWFNEKILRIKKFFASRAPWYGKFHASVSTFLGILIGFCAVVSLQYKSSQYTINVVAGALLLELIWVFYAHVKGRIFPRMSLSMAEKIPRISRNDIFGTVALLTALATIIGILHQMFND
mgnify:CR=1 FL=1